MATETAELQGTLAIPQELFTQFLSRVDDIVELKVILTVAFLCARSGTRSVDLHHLLRPEVIRTIVPKGSPTPAETTLRHALNRAVASGHLIRIASDDQQHPGPHFLLKTEQNTEMVERLRQGEEAGLDGLDLPSVNRATVYRPNVFALYEQHIGPLGPLVAEQLRDAEQAYPRSWLEEAIRVAVHYNRRNWRYIQTVLLRWEESGGPDGVSRRRT